MADKFGKSSGYGLRSAEFLKTVDSNPVLAIAPPTLPTGRVNVSYTSPAFTATGGSGSGYTFTVASGSLSPLTIGASTGIITGTPTTSGTLQFAIKVTDSHGNTITTSTLSITIYPTLMTTPPSLPFGVVGVGYTSPAFVASGGSGVGYTFTVASGSLSPLTIGSSTGIISGTPTMAISCSRTAHRSTPRSGSTCRTCCRCSASTGTQIMPRSPCRLRTRRRSVSTGFARPIR